MVKVLVVDDSAFMRKVLSQLIAQDPKLSVVDTARDGKDALEKILRLKPDLVTLDVEMPVMDGLEVLRRLKQECKGQRPRVIVCSSLTPQSSDLALQALSLGADDIITKSKSVHSESTDQLRHDLLEKIRALTSHLDAAAAPAPAASAPRTSGPGLLPARAAMTERRFDLLLIGSSTGGPPVLEAIVQALPADLRMPAVIAQHMPALFTKSLSERLAKSSRVKVVHADCDGPLKAGCVSIIQGGGHGKVIRDAGGNLAIRLSDQPKEAPYRPSVDELLSSGAIAAGENCLGVVLTGMGSDGGIGAEAIHKKGGVVLAQSKETCVVYGMPKAVVERGAALAQLSPAELASTLALLGPLGAGRSLGSFAAPRLTQAG